MLHDARNRERNVGRDAMSSKAFGSLRVRRDLHKREAATMKGAKSVASRENSVERPNILTFKPTYIGKGSVEACVLRKPNCFCYFNPLPLPENFAVNFRWWATSFSGVGNMIFSGFLFADALGSQPICFFKCIPYIAFLPFVFRLFPCQVLWRTWRCMGLRLNWS